MNKNLFSFFTLVICCTSAFNLNAQCGATDVEVSPQPLMICEGETAAMSFTASGTCAANWEYQVTQGASVVQAWNVSSTFTGAPSSSTMYTVFARCSACPTIIVQEDFWIEVLEEPMVTGDTLICSNSLTTLTATGSTGTGTYEWYDASSGGNLLSASDVFTTPNLTNNTTYWIGVQDTTVNASGGAVLITECGLSGFATNSSGGFTDADYLELSNLYGTNVNTTGWVAAVSNDYFNINVVHSSLWFLPSSFPPCSILSKNDVNGQPNYWGGNIFWNPNLNGWAIIIDDVGNVVDFVSWGWTAADLATFNPIINGFSITLGTEWTGNGCSSACGVAGGSPYSISRIGSTDNNSSVDFVCQPTSLNAVNPSLNCGWTSNLHCRYPVNIIVDQEPTASNPATINVQCAGDVPAPDVTVVTDEADDFTPNPIVTYVNDVSDGLSCPETITRTYQVEDTCGNFVNVQQLIVIHDTQGPVMDAPPAGATVQCVGDIPPPTMLGYTDNCDAPGTVQSTDGPLVGGGCGGTVTRTWTATDNCGNVSAPVTQIFTVMDNIAPTASAPAGMNVECVSDIPLPDGSVVPGVTDNCAAAPSVTHVGDVSNGLSCPETITRTYAVTDDCGNTTTVDQIFIVNDVTPPTASNPIPASYPLITDVPAGNLSTGAVYDEADNCTAAPIVTWVSDVSDNDICAGETITRTFSVMDDCGNEIFVTQAISIDPLPVPINAGPDQTICQGELTTLAPVNPMGANLSWSPAIPPGAFNPGTTTTYTVTAEFNGCTNSDEMTIVVEDPPVVSFIGDLLEGCEPLTVNFISTSTAPSGIANCEWSINGDVLTGCGPVSYTFPEGGYYDVTLTSTSNTGCENTETYTDYIYVESTPVASFGVSSNQLSTLETDVDFFNTSVGAVTYIWDFDDNTDLSYVEDPSHTFPTSDGGSYNVQLIAYSPLGCVDTTWATIAVDVELLYFVPNAFTPDGDAYNQTFKPVFTAGYDPYDFNIKIFNRWGEIVWESNDVEVGWDGTYGGEQVEDGTYTWLIEFKTAYSDERKHVNGHVTILR